MYIDDVCCARLWRHPRTIHGTSAKRCNFLYVVPKCTEIVHVHVAVHLHVVFYRMEACFVSVFARLFVSIRSFTRGFVPIWLFACLNEYMYVKPYSSGFVYFVKFLDVRVRVLRGWCRVKLDCNVVSSPPTDRCQLIVRFSPVALLSLGRFIDICCIMTYLYCRYRGLHRSHLVILQGWYLTSTPTVYTTGINCHA